MSLEAVANPHGNHHIRSGTLFELSEDDESDTEMISIDSRPRAEGEIWIGLDGVPVSSFMRKFDEGFEGWQPGEVVNARFILSHRDGQPELLVADAYVGDIRNADTFLLPELSEADDATLRELGMALIDAGRSY